LDVLSFIFKDASNQSDADQPTRTKQSLALVFGAPIKYQGNTGLAANRRIEQRSAVKLGFCLTS
jgi:hypothetical protein